MLASPSPECVAHSESQILQGTQPQGDLQSAEGKIIWVGWRLALVCITLFYFLFFYYVTCNLPLYISYNSWPYSSFSQTYIALHWGCDFISICFPQVWKSMSPKLVSGLVCSRDFLAFLAEVVEYKQAFPWELATEKVVIFLIGNRWNRIKGHNG